MHGGAELVRAARVTDVATPQTPAMQGTADLVREASLVGLATTHTPANAWRYNFVLGRGEPAYSSNQGKGKGYTSNMERSRSNSLGEVPLPGDRQGAPGADAGRDSERTVGGRVLRRRAPVIQQTTAPQEEDREVEELERAEDLLAPLPQGSPTVRRRAARRREDGRRLKWTTEMNIDVMRSFYIINHCRDEPLPGWRHALHVEFSRIHPTLNLTQQNVVDRKNVIIRKRYLSDLQLQTIKREVGYLIHQEEEYQDPQNHGDREEEVREEQIQMPNPTTEEEHQARFQSLIEIYKDMDPSKRPKLPKIRNIQRIRHTLNNINNILQQYLGDTNDLSKVHLGLYCAAVLTVELNGQQVYTPNPKARTNGERTPMWKQRLEGSINELRAQADLLNEYLTGNVSQKVKRKTIEIARRAHINMNAPNHRQELLNQKDLLRQKAKAKGARLRRYNELTKRKKQNSDFQQNQKQFLRNLEKSNENPQETNIDAARFTDYWKSIWSNAGTFNQDAPWIEEINDANANLNQMTVNELSKQDVTHAIKKLQNWKAPGPDGLHNFWLKYLTAAHESLARSFTEALNNPQAFPEFLTVGNTYMLYKKGDANHPKNYRPITCLSSVYKLFTSLINEKIYQHCVENNILEEEQKGCIRGAAGCKHQLTIDAIVLKQAQVKKRNLHMCYIDYKKAFDSVPHNWLMRVLETYKICPKIRTVLEHLMQTWKTNIWISGNNAGQVKIRRGIFQGDSLSPVWFCLAMNPLSTLLNKTETGYSINTRSQRKLTHLLYMDDLKLFSGCKTKLQALIETTKLFSDDINMEFGLEKCATISIRRGVPENNPEVYANIQQLPAEEQYRYLGIKQAGRLNHAELKRDFQERYKTRVTKLLNTLLSGGNLIKAINSWAVPVLAYSFGIVKWSITDLNELDRMTRRLLTKFRKLHTNSSVNRLYLPRRLGGRGLINIKNLCLKQETDLRSKLLSDRGLLMKTAASQDHGYTPLSLASEILQIDMESENELERQWMEHAMHGRFPKMLQADYVDKENSLKWLTDGSLYPETEGFLIAIQDRIMKTRNYQKHCLRIDIEDRCRKCGSPGETIEHIMGGCPALAETAYLGRHNQLAKIIHQQLAIKHGLLTTAPPYYKYSPEPVIETEAALIYWDRPIITDRTVAHNRPDIVLIDKRKKEGLIIDIAVPLTHNIQKTEQEKVNKYENLAFELKRIWKLDRVAIYPFVISAEGVMTSKFDRNIRALGLPVNIIRSGQKAVLLQTCHIVRSLLGQDEFPSQEPNPL